MLLYYDLSWLECGCDVRIYRPNNNRPPRYNGPGDDLVHYGEGAGGSGKLLAIDRGECDVRSQGVDQEDGGPERGELGASCKIGQIGEVFKGDSKGGTIVRHGMVGNPWVEFR